MFIIFFSFLHIAVYAAVEPAKLSQETLNRFPRVPEFEFIIQEAEKLGVKVYLFGGTASAFAHYVRWDLEREAGDDKYQEERFDYDFTNIYRGNQDLDIVVDGTSEQADQLQKILKEIYPHFIGDRDAWEVRLLKKSRGDKRALLNDPDFIKQHSDTNSTGMLLLNPDSNDIVYNDLLNWGSQESDFLNDVASARIKFLVGSAHEKTERFKKGLNPPVLAAIRYLAKLAQYEVEGTEEDLVLVTQIIQETKFKDLSNYGKKKAEEFALKTLLNAPNSEYAWNLLEKTGARRKLMAMDGDQIKTVDSLSWWLNKEPLRSKPLGKENGRTAREIFETDEIIVSHETNSFQAYENITRSSQGQANAFISRRGVDGEGAIHGNGFYTRVGLEGAVGNGLTIRFKLHPEAREGKDFKKEDDYIIIKNKNALTLIQENLNLSMKDFLYLIVTNAERINESNKGLLEKFKRKFKRRDTTSEEFTEAVKYVESLFKLPEDFPQDLDIDFLHGKKDSFESLFDLVINAREEFYIQKVQLNSLLDSNSHAHVAFVKKLVKENVLHKFLLQKELYKKEWFAYPEIILEIIEKGTADTVLLEKIINPKSGWIEAHPEILESFIEYSRVRTVVRSIISKVFIHDPWNKRMDLLVKIAKKRDDFLPHSIADFVVRGKIHPNTELMRALIKGRANPLLGLFHFLAENKAFSEDSELVQILSETTDSRARDSIITLLLPHDHWFQHRDLVEKLIKTGSESHLEKMIKYVFSVDKKRMNTHFFRAFLERDKVDQELASAFLSSPRWRYDDEFIEIIVERHDADKQLARDVFSRTHWKRRPDLLKKLIDFSGLETSVDIIKYSLSKQHWVNHPEFVEMMIDSNYSDFDVLNSVLSKPYWALKQPQLLLKLIEKHSSSGALVEFGKRLLPKALRGKIINKIENLLAHQNEWRYNPILLEYLGTEEVTLAALKMKMKFKNYKTWFLEHKQKKSEQELLTCSQTLY